MVFLSLFNQKSIFKSLSRFRFPAGAGNVSFHHRVQNGSGAHPASGHSPLSSDEVKECVELYVHSPNAPSWRGA